MKVNKLDLISLVFWFFGCVVDWDHTPLMFGAAYLILMLSLLVVRLVYDTFIK